MSRAKIIRTMFLSIATLLIAGCGGDGIDGTGLIEIRGTAAIGAPIASATVTVKASDGTKKTSQTGQNGKFKANVSGLNGPFLMKIVQANGSALFSIADGGGTANIHPFTDWIVRNWFKVHGLDIESEFNSSTAAAQLPSVAQINEIEAAIKKIIALVLVEYNLPADLNLISSVFEANNQGFDYFLDHADVVIIDNRITVIVNDPKSSLDGEIVKDVGLETNLAQSDVTPPSVPAGLRVIPANGTEMVVVWNPAADNLAVAGYKVYRQDQASATTTPFPVLSDSGLSVGTEYCYQVEAFDAANNVSAKTASVCATPLAAPDSTVPAAPTGLQASAAGSGAITLSWTPPQDADVVSYEIYRGSKGNVTTRIASVVAASYSNINLASTAEYCYQVFALDGAQNKSAGSNQACAVTAQGSQPLPTGPRSLEFSASTYSASETDATLLVTVNRNGDVSEPVSVNYQAGDGTATAPTDFVAASGTLTWPAFDTAAKTFLVQIKGDTATESTETVLLSLSNPSANAALSSNAGAVVNIANATCSGQLSSDVTVDTTITAACTLVTQDISIGGGATLTIAPGTTLVFQSGAGLSVKQDGALTITGTQIKPILLTGEQQTAGYWKGVQFTFSDNVKNQLDHATVEFGGASTIYGAANVVVHGTLISPSRLKIKNSMLSDSAAYGFEFNDGAIVDAFSNNVMTRNIKDPGSLPANLVGKLDTASSYTGNAFDQIFVVDNSSVTSDQTWPALNVPYSTGIHAINANLVIEAGATLIFRASGQLNVSGTGSLAAIGTATRMITFTAAQQTPGYWAGIQYTSSNSNNNTLDNVVVEYAGGTGLSGQGGVILYGSGALAPRAVIIDSVFRFSASYGIWLDVNPLVNADIDTVNTFANNALGNVFRSP